ncbi:hypothetical protein GO495_31460 [Chitinophaga oryziterrae]|uniref:Uncharacterized protein n=1 Tax=Chitinophaga oryziterrae TaxID=1031224 RepID=A0A6N8JLL8_9BACT|nr:hypothetical protein [Chitinophaga oryziterrae]MVT45148.1 hypothetical protein [Chitinophaga oryziterrae]
MIDASILPFLIEKFDKLIIKYNLALDAYKNGGGATLSNKNVKIHVIIYSWRDEGGVSIVIDIIKPDKKYYFSDLLAEIGVDTEIEYNNLEEQGLLNYENDEKKIIAGAAIILEKYCSRILTGELDLATG